MSTIAENLSKVRVMNRYPPERSRIETIPRGYVPNTCVKTCLLAKKLGSTGVTLLHRTASGSDRFVISEERLNDVNYDVWDDCKRWIARLHEGDEA